MVWEIDTLNSGGCILPTQLGDYMEEEMTIKDLIWKLDEMDRILLNRIEDIERRLYELEVKWKSKMQFKIG